MNFNSEAFIMSLLADTLSILKNCGIIPNRRLGQNFIVNSYFFYMIEKYSNLKRDDVVLDIGAGLGFLTKYLSNICDCVLAVELDKRIVDILHEKFAKYDNVKIFKGNILDLNLPTFNKIVSAPPYHISSQLFLWLFKKKFDCAVLILQKDFINRVLAPVGSKNYGFLTVLTHYYVNLEFMIDVPNRAFYPKPKVNSAIIRLKPKKHSLSVDHELLLQKLVKFLFTTRNRKVEKAINSFLKKNNDRSNDRMGRIIKKFDFGNKRVRNLTPEDFEVLSNAILN